MNNTQDTAQSIE